LFGLLQGFDTLADGRKSVNDAGNQNRDPRALEKIPRGAAKQHYLVGCFVAVNSSAVNAEINDSHIRSAA
jgi:hypothetical protein